MSYWNYRWFRPGWALWLSILCPLVAQAQPDPQMPLFIEADEVVMDEDRGLAVYRGNVRISQGAIHFKADAMTLFSSVDGIERVIASGDPVEYREQHTDAPPLIATGRRLDYVVKTGIAILTDTARVQQDGNLLRGERIVYSLTEGLVEVFGTSSGEVGQDARRIETTIMPSAIPVRDSRRGGGEQP